MLTPFTFSLTILLPIVLGWPGSTKTVTSFFTLFIAFA